jgi:hypothetical protein
MCVLEIIMTTKRKLISLLVAMSLALSVGWLYLTREIEISGDQFKPLVLERNRYMYSSWYLYFEGQQKYCLRYSRPIVPINYCIPKSDLEIRNSQGSKTSEIGYIGVKEFVLKANRRPGLAEEIF